MAGSLLADLMPSGVVPSQSKNLWIQSRKTCHDRGSTIDAPRKHRSQKLLPQEKTALNNSAVGMRGSNRFRSDFERAISNCVSEVRVFPAAPTSSALRSNRELPRLRLPLRRRGPRPIDLPDFDFAPLPVIKVDSMEIRSMPFRLLLQGRRTPPRQSPGCSGRR